jgi:uncharacterized repeat protein (TIGR01451 family)
MSIQAKRNALCGLAVLVALGLLVFVIETAHVNAQRYAVEGSKELSARSDAALAQSSSLILFWEEDFAAPISSTTYYTTATSGSGVVSNTSFLLTQNAGNQSGRIFYLAPTLMSEFTATFSLYLGNNDGGADGVAFIFCPSYDYPPAVGGSSLDASCPDGYLVAFDTYGLSYDEIYVAFQNTASRLVSAAVSQLQLEDGAWHTAGVDFRGGTITVTLDGSDVITGATLAGYEPFTGYFGFSGATGGATNEQRVDDIQVHAPPRFLTKTADPTLLDLGDPMTYTLTFRNSHAMITATNVLITDIVSLRLSSYTYTTSGVLITPTGSVDYVWQVEDLAPGAGGVITISGLLSASLSPAQTFTNTARFSSVFSAVLRTYSTSAAVTRRGADLAVGKVDALDPVVAGERLTYTLTITNHGPAASQGTVLTDVQPGSVTFLSASPGCHDTGDGITCTVGSLLVGATTEITIAVTAPGTAGTITNTVGVAGFVDDPEPSNNTASESTWVSAEADLEVGKSDWPDPVLAGELLTYTLVVANHGPDWAGGVVLTDALPSVVSYYPTLTASQGNCTINGSLTCDLGSMPPGTVATVTLPLRVSSGQIETLTNTAHVSGYVPDPVSGNNDDDESTLVETQTDLGVGKRIDPDLGLVLSPITYTIVVSNSGPSDARNVLLTDTLRGALIWGAITPSQGNCGAPSGGSFTCTLGTISDTHRAQVTLVVTPSAAGRLTNTVRVAGNQFDPFTGNDVFTHTVDISEIDLALTKSADPTYLSEGDDVTYTLLLINNGPVPASGVVVSESLPSGISVTGSEASHGSYTSPIWDMGGLAVGEVATLTITGTAGADTAAQLLVNTAVLSASTPPDTIIRNNAASADVQVAGADLGLSKAADDDEPDEGGTMVYELQVTNLGPDDTTGVVVSDTLPLGVIFVSSSATQGDYDEISGAWTAGALNVDDSATLHITATVDADTAGDTIVNRAAIRGSDQPDSLTANNVADATITVSSGGDIYLPLVIKDH